MSLVLGVLLWPRGATSTLGQALAEAYQASAEYLRVCVTFGMKLCDPAGGAPASPQPEALRAAAAARRLGDAFRGFLAERGTRHLPLAQVTALTTGAAGLRLTADAVLDLWSGSDDVPAPDRAVARAELLVLSERVALWYETLADALADRRPAPEPLAQDRAADARLLDAVRRKLQDAAGHATAGAVRMIWSADHVDAARRLQRGIAGPAGTVVAVRSGRPLPGAVLRRGAPEAADPRPAT